MAIHRQNLDDNAIKSDRDKAQKRMTIHRANPDDNRITAEQQSDQKQKKYCTKIVMIIQ